MKNRFFKTTTVLMALAAFFGCTVDNKVIDNVFEGAQYGAFLRILETSGDIIDLNDTGSTFSIKLEYQDHENSALLDRVEFFAVFTDNTVGGGADLSKTVPLATVAQGAFTPGSFKLLQTTFSFTYGEALTALGLSQSQVEGEDSLVLAWTLYTTDGRSFDADSANGNIAAIGGYYSSPYKYSTAFKCGLTDTSTLFNGDFKVTYDEWADYAEGDLIPVTPDPGDPLSFRILSTNNPYINNAATSWLTVTIIDGDGNVTVQSNEDFDYGGGFVVPVTGTGKINTCTGDIDVSLDFSSSYAGYGMTLVKA
ncbi:MAG: hypothetical protein MUO53_09375 [Maribacter sp.]|nr:hypothetical protein [Maribacter sp.]